MTESERRWSALYVRRIWSTIGSEFACVLRSARSITYRSTALSGGVGRVGVGWWVGGLAGSGRVRIWLEGWVGEERAEEVKEPVRTFV